MIDYANSYLDNRIFNESWTKLSDPKKESALDLAESIIKGEYGEGISNHQNFYKSVCEQALFLVDNYDRLKLKMQGVESTSISGASSESYRDSNIISPIAKKLLNRNSRVVFDL